MTLLKVIEPGTLVLIGPKHEVEARILDLSVKEGGYVQYRVVWWSGNDRKTEWIEQSELLICDEQLTLQFGFANAN